MPPTTELPHPGAPAPEPAVEMGGRGLSGQLRPVALIKAAQMASMALFTVAAPRLLGPERFGELALVLSISSLWVSACTLGGRYVFGRFIPEYAARGETLRVRAVFMHVLQTRVATALVAAPLLFLLLARTLPEASRPVLLGGALAFAAMTLASPLYNVFFGLNRLGTSMSRDAFAQLLLLALLFALGAQVSLERTVLAVLATQLVVLAIGAVLCRRLFTLDRSAFDLRELLGHLRFGAGVFAANLLLRLPWRLGETSLALLGTGAAEIGFFSLALSVAAAFTRIMGGATTLQIPSLAMREASGDTAGRDRGLGIALRYLLVAAILFVLVVPAVAPLLVAKLFGEAYLGVIPNLRIVSCAVLGAPIVRTALSYAVLRVRVARSAALGAAAVASFAATAMLLVPARGATGASIAIAVSSLAAAALALLQIRGTAILSGARIGRQLWAAAPPAAILLLLGASPPVAAVAAGLYVALVLALRILDRGDLRRIAIAAAGS